MRELCCSKLGWDLTMNHFYESQVFHISSHRQICLYTKHIGPAHNHVTFIGKKEQYCAVPLYRRLRRYYV